MDCFYLCLHESIGTCKCEINYQKHVVCEDCGAHLD